MDEGRSLCSGELEAHSEVAFGLVGKGIGAPVDCGGRVVPVKGAGVQDRTRGIFPINEIFREFGDCLLYTSPSPRD